MIQKVRHIKNEFKNSQTSLVVSLRFRVRDPIKDKIHSSQTSISAQTGENQPRERERYFGWNGTKQLFSIVFEVTIKPWPNISKSWPGPKFKLLFCVLLKRRKFNVHLSRYFKLFFEVRLGLMYKTIAKILSHSSWKMSKPCLNVFIIFVSQQWFFNPKNPEEKQCILN